MEPRYEQKPCKVCGELFNTLIETANHIADKVEIDGDQKHKKSYSFALSYIQNHPEFAARYPRKNKAQEKDNSLDVLNSIHADLQEIIRLLQESVKPKEQP